MEADEVEIDPFSDKVCLDLLNRVRVQARRQGESPHTPNYLWSRNG
jgi:hypothetical protein